MASKHLYTDGKEIKTIDPWHSDGPMWTYAGGGTGKEALDDELYARVAAVYRAINFTADTLSNMHRGGFEFQPYSFAKEYFGNWVSIEAADVNADGKTDIVLGLSNYPELVPANWLTEHPAMQGRDGKAPSVMYLINTH